MVTAHAAAEEGQVQPRRFQRWPWGHLLSVGWVVWRCEVVGGRFQEFVENGAESLKSLCIMGLPKDAESVFYEKTMHEFQLFPTKINLAFNSICPRAF